MSEELLIKICKTLLAYEAERGKRFGQDCTCETNSTEDYWNHKKGRCIHQLARMYLKQKGATSEDTL